MTSDLWKPTLGLAALIEAATAFLRFGLGMQATRDTASSIGRLTFGMRIHHGMAGLVLILFAVYIKDNRWKRILTVVGGALSISDALHHFVILWAVTGSPEFDLFYPR